MSLLDIARKQKFNTDKLDHGYLEIYERYFSEIENNVTSVLEMGVKEGGSLQLWSNRFPEAVIYGIDIDPRAAEKCSSFTGIHVFTGSQINEDLLWGIAPSFDVIIDDCSHLNELTIRSFEILWSKLSSGGIYIIEDMKPTYRDVTEDSKDWPGLCYVDKVVSRKNDRNLLNTFFCDIIKEMDLTDSDFRFIHFWRQTVILGKRC